MNLFCIVSCAFLIATVKASISSTPNPDYPYDYYDEHNPEDNRVENNMLEDQNVQDSSLPPTFITKPGRFVVKNGESATLHCQTKNAEDYVLIWRRGTEMVSQGRVVYNQDLYAVQKDNSLFIKHVDASITGYYSCEIQISQNPKPKLTHRLKLENDVEIISLKAEDNATQLYPGDTLTLTCVVDGKPLPTVTWYFDGNEQSGPGEIKSNKVQSSETSNTLVIENVDFKHNGTYKCIADNQKSFDQQAIVIEVFDKGRDAAASHTDSRISKGLQLAPSILVLLTTIMLMNP